MDLTFDVIPSRGRSREDLLALLESDDPGGLKELIPEARISENVLLQESIDYVPMVLSVVLSVPAGVASSLIASWLTSLLKGKAKAIIVDRTIIELDEEKIARVIHEHIEVDGG
jgi:hypothetical protein